MTKAPKNINNPVSRRQLFTLTGAGIAGTGIGIVADRTLLSSIEAVQSGSRQSSASSQKVSFFGEHQSGIITPAQDRLHFASFDVDPSLDREGLVSLLREWTNAAADMCNGKDVGEFGSVSGPYDAPPEDTGEAQDLSAAQLTITIGFGETLFRDKTGKDRFGISSHLPKELTPLPHFPGDTLDPAQSDGDLCIQACANDPQVAVHAIRNLSRIAFGKASIRWSQLGFGRTSSTSTTQVTARNLFGFKDGTNNLKAENTKDIKKHVWTDSANGHSWLTGGSYLVTRRIRMIIESWDRGHLKEQERIIGRNKSEGAPLSGGTEFSQPDFDLMGKGNIPLIDTDSHVRLAHPTHNSSAALLRRGYNFVDGNDELGRLNAGLFFISYQKSPRQFIQVQSNLAKNDALNEYIRHTGSALFVIPPGCRPGGFIGDTLFS